jgi:hypothetical protein
VSDDIALKEGFFEVRRALDLFWTNNNVLGFD